MTDGLEYEITEYRDVLTAEVDLQRPWEHRGVLRILHGHLGMDACEIADRYPVNETTIERWLRKTGCVSDDEVEVGTDGRGRTNVHVDGHKVSVHKLAAYAEHGSDVFDSEVVHHTVPIPWLNIPEYLVPMDRGEHNKVHGQELRHKDGFPTYLPVEDGNILGSDGEIVVSETVQTEIVSS